MLDIAESYRSHADVDFSDDLNDTIVDIVANTDASLKAATVAAIACRTLNWCYDLGDEDRSIKIFDPYNKAGSITIL